MSTKITPNRGVIIVCMVDEMPGLPMDLNASEIIKSKENGVIANENNFSITLNSGFEKTKLATWCEHMARRIDIMIPVLVISLMDE